MATIDSGSSRSPSRRPGTAHKRPYRLTEDEARARYVDPEPVPNSLEVREVNDTAQGYGHKIGRPPSIV
jgi:hypothetical protein